MLSEQEGDRDRVDKGTRGHHADSNHEAASKGKLYLGAGLTNGWKLTDVIIKPSTLGSQPRWR